MEQGGCQPSNTDVLIISMRDKMRLLGSVELTTHNRITMPSKLVKALKIGEGDFLLFYEDKGVVTVKVEKG